MKSFLHLNVRFKLGDRLTVLADHMKYTSRVWLLSHYVYIVIEKSFISSKKCILDHIVLIVRYLVFASTA